MNNPYSSFNSPEESAKSLLFHYFALAIGALDRDNAIEIGSIVDGILEAVKRSTVEYRLESLEKEVASYKKSLRTANQLLEECHKSLISAGQAPDHECAEMCISPLQEKLAEYFAD